MSLKAKNLEFDKSQPAFLRRLQREIVGQGDGDSDRHHNAATRPTRPDRLAAGEDEGPIYVMEGTNAILTKDEYEAILKGKEGVSTTERDSAEATDKNHKISKGDLGVKVDGRTRQQPTATKGAKKRKAIKIVKGDDDGNSDGNDNDAGLDVGDAVEKSETKNEETSESPKRKVPKRKKAKVKIDFGHDDAA